MAKRNHVHRLKRHKYKNGEVVFFCVLDDCSFKINADLVWGKTAECWRCNLPFSMTNETKRQDKPHCEGCTKPRGSKPIAAKRDIAQPLPGILEPDIRTRLNRLVNPTPSVLFDDDADML